MQLFFHAAALCLWKVSENVRKHGSAHRENVVGNVRKPKSARLPRFVIFLFVQGLFPYFCIDKNSMNPSRVRISRELKPAGIQALLTKLEGYEEKLQASQP